MTEVELLPECQDCKSTKDLAQCPECHLWFCKKHDTHECTPQQQTSDLKKRIASAKTRRKVGIAIWFLAAVFIISLGFALEYYSELMSPIMSFTIFLAIAFAWYAFSYIPRHYNNQLKKMGVQMRSIRPETAKKDR